MSGYYLETLSYNITTWHHNPQDHDLNLHHFESLKSHRSEECHVGLPCYLLSFPLRNKMNQACNFHPVQAQWHFAIFTSLYLYIWQASMSKTCLLVVPLSLVHNLNPACAHTVWLQTSCKTKAAQILRWYCVWAKTPAPFTDGCILNPHSELSADQDRHFCQSLDLWEFEQYQPSHASEPTLHILCQP